MGVGSDMFGVVETNTKVLFNSSVKGLTRRSLPRFEDKLCGAQVQADNFYCLKV